MWLSAQSHDILVAVQQPLSRVFISIKHQQDKMCYAVNQLHGQSSSSPLLSSGSVPPPPSSHTPLLQFKHTPPPQSKHTPPPYSKYAPPAFSYMEPGVVPRNLSLEADNIPTSWQGQQPEALEISVLNYPIWGTAMDIPSLPHLIEFIHRKYNRFLEMGKYSCYPV